SKIRLKWLPDTLKPAGSADASIVRILEIVTWPLVRMLVFPDSAASNVMVPAPALVLAKMMALRSVPGPLSARLVAVGVAAEEVSGVASSPANARRQATSDGVFMLWIS